MQTLLVEGNVRIYVMTLEQRKDETADVEYWGPEKTMDDRINLYPSRM